MKKVTLDKKVTKKHNAITGINTFTLPLRYVKVSWDSTRPNTLWLEYAQGWSSTKAIHYGDGRFGYDAPGVWPLFVRRELKSFIDWCNG